MYEGWIGEGLDQGYGGGEATTRRKAQSLAVGPEQPNPLEAELAAATVDGGEYRWNPARSSTKRADPLTGTLKHSSAIKAGNPNPEDYLTGMRQPIPISRRPSPALRARSTRPARVTVIAEDNAENNDEDQVDIEMVSEMPADAWGQDAAAMNAAERFAGEPAHDDQARQGGVHPSKGGEVGLPSGPPAPK